MIVKHMSVNQLKAHIMTYNIMLSNAVGSSKLNIIDFRNQCQEELRRKLNQN